MSTLYSTWSSLCWAPMGPKGLSDRKLTISDVGRMASKAHLKKTISLNDSGFLY